MSREKITRLSLIDSTVETVIQLPHPPLETLELVFERIIVQMLTLDGYESIEQLRVVGSKKDENEKN